MNRSETRTADVPLTDTPWAGPKPPLATLIMLSAVSPLAINLFVPSMPSIAADLNAPYATIQLGLSLYLIVTAALQLVIGPLSDLFGRRPVVFAGLLLFLAGTVMCVLAETAIVFLAGRVIQAASATGMVLSRTIVRDVYPREKSASMIGYMVMGMAIAPMVAPAIGGLIDQVSGWRMSFIILGVFGAVITVAAFATLPETNRYRGARIADQIASYRALVKIPLFWLYTAVAGFTSAIFFGFLGGGPAVSSVYLGLSPFIYGLYFAFCAIGYAFGNYLSGRYSEHRGVERMMVDGAVISVAGPIITVILFAAGLGNPFTFFIPLALVGVGNGMTLPNVTAAAIGLRPDAAGAASGLLGAFQVGLGAISSIVAGILVGEAGLPIPLCLFLSACGLIAIVFTRPAIRMAARS